MKYKCKQRTKFDTIKFDTYYLHVNYYSFYVYSFQNDDWLNKMCKQNSRRR